MSVTAATNEPGAATVAPRRPARACARLHGVRARAGVQTTPGAVIARQAGDQLVLVEHPPVLPLGRGAVPPTCAALGAARRAGVPRRPRRGCDLPWPGALVGYPIVHLRAAGRVCRRRLLETALIDTCAHFGVRRKRRRVDRRVGRQGQDRVDRHRRAPRRRIRYRLNVSTDLVLRASSRVAAQPTVTSLAVILGAAPSLVAVGHVFAERFAAAMGFAGVEVGAAA